MTFSCFPSERSPSIILRIKLVDILEVFLESIRIDIDDNQFGLNYIIKSLIEYVSRERCMVL